MQIVCQCRLLFVQTVTLENSESTPRLYRRVKRESFHLNNINKSGVCVYVHWKISIELLHSNAHLFDFRPVPIIAQQTRWWFPMADAHIHSQLCWYPNIYIYIYISPASPLFAQVLVQAQIKGNIKAPRHLPLWPVNSPHKGPVTRKMFPFDDVIVNMPVLLQAMAGYSRINHVLVCP